MMGSVWAAGFLLRRLRAEVGVVALLVALVALTSFLFAGAPRLFNLVADAALVDQLRTAAVTDRDIGERHYSVTSPRFAIPEPPRYSTFLTLRYQDGLTDAIRLVAGRLPAPNGEPLPIATLNFDDDVIAGACITHEGEIRHEGAKKAAG